MSAVSVPRRRRRTAGFMAIAVTIGAFTAHQGSPVDATDTPDDETAELAQLILDEDEPIGVTGERAVELLELTSTTEIVAGNAAMEPDELVGELLADPAMFVTGDGMVGYVDQAMVGDLGAAQADVSAALAPETCSDAYALSSLPGEGKVLYLDFTGHRTVDAAWNNGTAIDSPAYGGGPAAICAIWRRVAEDYLPFNVNVTTVEPPAGGLQKSGAGDQQYGQRVVVSPWNWTGSPDTLGIALLNVFDDVSDRSAFVFTERLGTANIAEAISHEAGHTLGLLHDGTAAATYYPGHDVWASLMGSPVNRQMTQWSRGEYAGANNGQNDVAIIAGYTGYRPDDPDPLPVTVGGSTYTASGIIGVGGDVDVFAVEVQTDGLLSVNVTPSLSSGSNLLAGVVVRNSAGTAVAKSPDPISLPASWSTSATAFVVAGRYTVEVRAIGYRNPLDSGFSTYGSMGEYKLAVTATPGAEDSSLANTSRLTSVTPDRLLDTRTGFGGSTRLAAGQQITLQVTGRANVPPGATAAVLNVVAADPVSGGFITMFPCSATRPETSTVNYVRGQIVANTAIATLSPIGQVCLYAMSETDIVVDVTAWLGTSGASRFTSYGPDRVMDTRSGLGGATRLPAGGTVAVDVSWLPADTTAVSLSIVAVNGATGGFVTAYPCAAARPFTSTINHVAGDIRSNNTIVGVSGGRVCIYSLAAVDIVVDLTGYFATAGLNYLPAAPDRLLDTRKTIGYVPPTGAVSFRGTNGSIPARAVSVNITATDHAVDGFVTNYDCFTRRVTSTVNPVVGEVNANGAIAPIANGFDSCLYTKGGGNLVVDIGGWWVP